MKKFFAIFSLVFMSFALVACGERVEIPPAHVGKIQTKNGFKPETLPPSKFRLELCWAYCDKLFLVDVSNFPVRESIKVFMPKDELNMTFDVRMTLATRTTENSINRIFDKIVAGDDNLVTGREVYDTYAQQVIRSAARNVMTQYTISEVASNRERVNAEISDSIIKGLESKPIEVIEVGLADVQYPDVIVNAQEAAKEREVEIKQQEAKNQIIFSRLKADLEVAKQQRAIDREKAEAAKEQNEIYSNSVSDRYLKWKTLEVMEKLAENENTVFVPMAALDEVGLSVSMFNKK